MYSEKTLQQFRNPEFVGELKDANGVGEEGNMKCGDMMKLFIKVEDNRIVDINFQTYGCVAAIASTNMLCTVVKGKTLDEVEKMGPKNVIDELEDLPAIKFHCSVMGFEALRNAIKDYKEKHSSQDP